MARLKGFEPLTHSLEGCCSIHLSYRRKSFHSIEYWKMKIEKSELKNHFARKMVNFQLSISN